MVREYEVVRRNLLRRFGFSVLVGSSVLIGGVASQAQLIMPSGSCPVQVDDGFNVVPAAPCSPVTPAFPTFPTAITMPGLYACISDCQSVSQADIDVILTTPTFDPQSCTEFRAVLRCVPSTAGNGAPTIGTTINDVRGIFSRTFLTAGGSRQVWRFAVNVELQFPNPPMNLVCPLPDCLAQGIFSFVPAAGILDLSCGLDQAGQTTWEFSLALTHSVGCVSHVDSAFNTQRLPAGAPGSHPDRSFHIVAPRPFTFLAPSLPLPAAVDIASISDALRSTSSFTSPICGAESPISVNLTSNQQDCLCSSAPGSLPIYYHQTIQPTSFAVGPPPGLTPVPFFSIPAGPLVGGFLQQYLGRWGATVSDHPNTELFTNSGLVSYVDSCPTLSPPGGPASFHFCYGGTTIFGGVPANQPTLFASGITPPTAVTVLTDFADSYTLLPPNSPIFGQSVRSLIVWELSR